MTPPLPYPTMPTIDTQSAEDLVRRLTTLVLQPEAAQYVLGDDDWLEERILDVVEAANHDESLAGYGHEFCQDLARTYPQSVRADFARDI